MRKLSIVSLAIVMTFVAGMAAAQVSPIRGEGVVTSLTQASSLPLTFNEKITVGMYAPSSDQTLCGKTYKKGAKYHIFEVNSSENPGVQALVTWELKEGEDPGAFGTMDGLKVGGLPPSGTTLQMCDTVTVQWQAQDGGKWVTVNTYRGGESTGLFSFQYP